MTNSKKKQKPSLIAMLAKSRAKIFQKAEAEAGRILTAFELEQVNAVNAIIANTPAQSTRDAAIQAATAFDILECCGDEAPTEMCVENLHAALRSMASALATRRAA